MRFIRLIVISFIVLFVIVTAISLFIPSHVWVSRAINVKATPDRIMTYIADPLKWKSWYPGLDSAKLLMEQGEVKGMILSEVPKRYIVLASKSPTEVTTEYINSKNRKVINGWKLINNPTDSLTVQWYMDFHLRWYPWEKFASLVFERSNGAKMEQGLKRLKQLVEE